MQIFCTGRKGAKFLRNQPIQTNAEISYSKTGFKLVPINSRFVACQ